MALMKCPNCPGKFLKLVNLSRHLRENHPQSLSASIRNGQRRSNKMPSVRARRLTQCVTEIASLVATVTPAIVSRDPSFAPAVLQSIGKSIDACKDLLPRQ